MRALGFRVTRTPKVCKIMAFMAVIMGSGLFFTYFEGLGLARSCIGFVSKVFERVLAGFIFWY